MNSLGAARIALRRDSQRCILEGVWWATSFIGLRRGSRIRSSLVVLSASSAMALGCGFEDSEPTAPPTFGSGGPIFVGQAGQDNRCFGSGGTTAQTPGNSSGGMHAGAGGTTELNGVLPVVGCPREPSSETEGRSCEQNSSCVYADGSRCDCVSCDSGFCWTCALAPLPLGCPRVVPTAGSVCYWSGATCNYDTCSLGQHQNQEAVCCNGIWSTFANSCPMP